MSDLTQYTYLYTSAENDKISIVEKIDRISDLQDVDLVDVENLQFLANNLGYNVDINRGELGVTIPNISPSTSADEVGKYLRNVVGNLVEWYKVKTNKSSIRAMLFSFGIIGDLSPYYTKDYLPDDDGGNWRTPDFNFDNSSLKTIPKDYYPTPYFTIWADLDESSTNLSWDYNKREQLINAVNSIKPISSVFKNLSGFVRREKQLYIKGWIKYTRYIKIQ
jgi:hypothetical protein